MTTVTAIDERAIRETDIAVIGMAGRFPGARGVDDLWRLVRDGASGLTPLTDEELLARGVPAATLQDPTYVKVAGRIADVESFDAGFFGIGPRDAAIMDPQVRHFLECAWEALEQAGHMPETFPGAIGVYAGCGMNGYLLHNLLPNAELVTAVGMFLLRHTGNDKDFLATTVSYRLNLQGPSLTVQTACSTSLVAVHLAVQALLNGECDLALAGGVTIQVPHGVGYHYREGEMAAPDGRCRAFDAESNGTVFTSGVGVVALRRLRDALAEGDTVYAVIKGSAVNNDGAQKVSYLAPSVDGYAKAVAEAIAIAGVPADSIGLVLTHGMGTPLGDQIEVAALSEAFRGFTDRIGFCRLASIKPNIGHTDTAAGVAGLIVAAQALRHGVLPPLANLTQPHPALNLTGSPFYLSAECSPWPSAGTPRRAGVSAIGIGGTNAHVVLEEAPPAPPSAPARPWQPLVLSAKTPAALARATARLAEHLRTDPDVNLADVAYTLQLGRRALPYRRVAVCRDVADAVATLAAAADHPACTGTAPPTSPAVVLLCPDGPLLRCEAWQALSAAEPTYREAVERCLATLEERDQEAVRRLLLPAEQRPAPSPSSPAAQVIAAVVARYALAQLWSAWGVRPVAALGHGIGAHAAACIAGATPLDAALARLARRPASDDSPPAGGVLVPDTPYLLYPVPATSTERFAPDHTPTPLQDPTTILLVLGEAMTPSPSAPHAPPPPGTVVVALPGDTPAADPRPALLKAAARLWLAGCPLRWEALHQGERRRRVPLPTYPFERQHHWLEPPPAPPVAPARAGRVTIARLSPTDGRAAPADDLEGRVRAVWEEVLGIEGIGMHDDFFDLGGQSVLAARLVQRLKEAFGVDLGVAALFEARTVAQMAALVRAARVPAAIADDVDRSARPGFGRSSLVPIKAAGTRPPLFCVHGAPGHVWFFRALAAHLDPEQPLFALQAQGPNDHQPPPTTIPEMARQYLEEIRTFQPRGPYFLGGYSGGGAVAFEMAQQLLAAGESVALLALIDAYCPPAIRSHELAWHVERGLTHKIARTVGNVAAGGPTLLVYGLKHRARTLRPRTGGLGATDGATAGPDPFTDLSPYFLMGWDRYDPIPIAVPLTLLRAATRIEVKRLPPDLGWGPYAAAGIETYRVPGDHFTVVYEPYAHFLARALTRAVRRADARQTPARG